MSAANFFRQVGFLWLKIAIIIYYILKIFIHPEVCPKCWVQYIHVTYYQSTCTDGWSCCWVQIPFCMTKCLKILSVCVWHANFTMTGSGIRSWKSFQFQCQVLLLLQINKTKAIRWWCQNYERTLQYLNVNQVVRFCKTPPMCTYSCTHIDTLFRHILEKFSK
jgi:hypothetical protein